MFTRIRNLHPLTGMVIGVVATLVLSGTAIAVTDASFTYSTVQTGYLMIAPADLVPGNNFHANDYFIGIREAGTSSSACFNAAVHLPQGARMTSVRTSYGSGPATNLYLDFKRANPVTGTSAYLIGRSVVDDSSTLTYVNDAVPANLGLVNNALYTYSYFVCVGSDTYFYGARITYQYTSAGD